MLVQVIYCLKSPIWAYFAFEVDEQGRAIDEKHLRCRVSWCKKTIVYSGNATNLHQHTEKWHPHLHKQGSRSNESGPSTQATFEE